ncbi:YihY family inner membrane protein [Massilia sp. CCM 9210]|uniref:YihY family inner membrane protein n=1 Tax=Massilia scottii TaxID=3057166 RepID=UPI0027966612|nr:YihY family inner membrane protein [Massilia sp. CCM 9210]MDQ1816972.1 YihY family inner membrane protein [Massilia sp. CCM 9210]
MINSSVDMVRGLTWSEARDLLRFARRRLNEEKLPQVAGSLTFTTTLALVPLLTIVLAIFTTFPVFSNFRVALEAYFAQTLMPKAIANTITGNLTQFASKAKSLSAVGAIALVLTSAAMMNMIERAFNQIWRVREVRPIAQRVTIYWALVTLGPLLFGLSLTATSQLFMATSALTSNLPFLSTLFYTAASVGLTTGAYTLLYMTVPNRFVDWRDAVWGGLVAAVAFEVAKRLFAMFVSQFPTYAIIYGALAALPLFLVWIYLSWMITLVGALLTAALPIVKYERWWYEPVPGGAFVDAMAILKVLHGRAQVSDTALVSSAAIRAHTRIGYDEMTTLLEQMLAVGWVGRVQANVTTRSRWGKRAIESAENWVLLVNVEKLRLADVYRLFVFGRTAIEAAVAIDLDKDTELDRNSPMTLDGSALARQVECAVEDGLNQTLAQHFAAPLAPAARA